MSLAEEMAQWEVHALRGLVSVLIVDLQLYARTNPDAKPLAERFVRYKRHFEIKHLEALHDPHKRGLRP